MSSERTRRLLDLVAEALNLPDPDRAQWLANECGDDRDLFREAAELIGLESNAADFLPVDNISDSTPLGFNEQTYPRYKRVAPPKDDFTVGAEVGDYVIEEQIGSGGMGVVYRARQVSLNRLVALKVLPAYMRESESANTRFRREIEAAAGLHHTNVVAVFSTGEHDGALYYAMELIDGPPLSQLLRHLRAKPAAELEWAKLNNQAPSEELPDATTPGWAVSCLTGSGTFEHGELDPPTPGVNSGDYFDRISVMLADAAEALHYAHQHGVIHRDIKPSNLLLSREGRLHITDFGLARLAHHPRLTRTGEMLGTPYYMAPEQILAESSVDGRADVYALGATLYELLTLRPPFLGENREQVIRQIIEHEPVAPRRFNRRAPRDLETICLKALQKDPADRYASGSKMAADLRAYVHRYTISAKPVGVLTRTIKWARRHPALSGMLTIACCCALVATFFAFRAYQTQSLWDEAQQKQVFEKAMLAALEGKTTVAEEALQQARRLQAPAGEISLLEGQIDFMAANYSRAHVHFERAAKKMPENIAAQSLLALTCMKQLQYEEGESIYNRMYNLKAKSLEDLIHRARLEAYFEPSQAAATLDEAVERERSSLVARLVRAEVQFSRALDTADITLAEQALGDYRIARQLLGDTDYVTSGLIHAHLAAISAYSKHGEVEKLQSLTEVVKELAGSVADSKSYRTQRAVAFAMDYVGETEAAIQQQRRFQRRQVLYLVLTLLREGRFAEASEACLQVKRGPTVDRMLTFFRALIASMEHGTAEAVQAEFDMQGSIMIDAIHEMLIVYSIGCLVETQETREAFCKEIVRQKRLPTFRHEWYEHLAEFVSGKISNEQLLAAAQGSRKSLCEAHYYIGADYLSKGDRRLAKKNFEEVISSGVYSYFEYYLCRALVAHMERQPEWPKWKPNNDSPVQFER